MLHCECLQASVCLGNKPQPTRAGRVPRRQSLDNNGCWLLWIVHGPGMVGAAIVRQECGWAPVLQYITMRPNKTSKAYELVCAAERLVQKLGYNMLFSAADLTQNCNAFQGKAKPAIVAHKAWGFRKVGAKVRKRHCNIRYGKQSHVEYVVEVLH